MPLPAVEPVFEPFLDTAEAVAELRPEVDRELVREIFHEAAILLHNGLALDGLDDHDAQHVVSDLCIDLVATDPGAAIRARAASTLEGLGDPHDREAVWAAYLTAAAILQI